MWLHCREYNEKHLNKFSLEQILLRCAEKNRPLKVNIMMLKLKEWRVQLMKLKSRGRISSEESALQNAIPTV